MRHLLLCIGFMLCCAVLTGCAESGATAESSSVLRLAVTTSTRDSGLLDVLLPVFAQQHGVRVDVIAVGTGAALKLGEQGDVDVVLVHAREAEDAFMAAGHGVRREDVMANRFELLGPADARSEFSDLDAASALNTIAADHRRFVSRGDHSGTHHRELKLWQAAGGRPDWNDYLESGQGMGATLTMADEMQAYTLCDRGTFLKLKPKISLVPLVTSPSGLANPYGILVVNPDKHRRVNFELAQQLVDFFLSADTQQRIADYTIEGEPLFHPRATPPKESVAPVGATD